MEKCPDCDSINVFKKCFGLGVQDEGDGVCDACHGDGLGGTIDRIADGLSGGETPCWKCGGSGVCQTCGGSGVVE